MNTNNRPLNFLFVMPRLVQSIGDGYVFPLGVAYVSASMKKAGFNVFTVNLNHHEGTVEDILRRIVLSHDIDVVATGGLSPQLHMVKKVVDSAKRIDRRIITVVGGGLISADPETAMQALECVDFGVIGEGEVTMCELASCLEQNGEFHTVDGIIFKDHTGDFHQTSKRQDIEDLNSIPWPDYEGFDIEKYLETPSANFAGVSKNRVICMLGSRSCPFRCTFCFHTNGYKYRQRSLDDFFNELDYLVANYAIEYIALADELFAPQLDRAKEFCERIKKYNIPWYADFRIDMITPELLDILKDSNLDVMFFGLESANNVILASMRKGITIEQIERTLQLVTSYGMAVYGCFIFGDIEESYATAMETIKWWREHQNYNIHLTLVKPFPGTKIYEHALSKGCITDPLQYLQDGCPQVNISKMDDVEFSDIMQFISHAQEHILPIESLELITANAAMGRETISGICSNCHQSNTWENIKLFANDYIYCSRCGQKFDIPCPPALLTHIELNFTALIEKYKKVGVWGMTQTIMHLFKRSVVLQQDTIFPIDISESKRKMNLHGKKIYAPDIIEREGIEAVVISVPSHGGQIRCQVQTNHKDVKEILDICSLIEIRN